MERLLMTVGFPLLGVGLLSVLLDEWSVIEDNPYTAKLGTWVGLNENLTPRERSEKHVELALGSMLFLASPLLAPKTQRRETEGEAYLREAAESL